MKPKLTMLLISSLLLFCPVIYSQTDSSNISTGNIYQDLSKSFDIKNAKFILIMNKDKSQIDTSQLRKIDPNWLEKVNTLNIDPNKADSKISTIEIYIRKKYIKNAKHVLNQK